MATPKPHNKRQAVVIIHGIGEQRPMETLRSFLAGIGVKRFFNKPHQFSENFELRRFSTAKTTTEAGERPKTDYFELYWAHHFNPGNIRGSLLWAIRLLGRRPFWRHGRQLRWPIAVVQIAILFLIGVLLWWVGDALSSGGLSVGVQRLRLAIGTAAAVVSLVGGRFLTTSLADAVRYLTPTPGNLKARNEIKADGLRLLHALHDSGHYQRIVVVGHSLGSVIGLDILRIAWDELRHPDPTQPQNLNEADKFDELVKALPEEPNDQQIEDWQRAQHQLWRESRARGMRWLVTDFVTLGSPLAHASFLFDGRRLKFGRRKQEGEYPKCPPIDNGSGIFYDEKYVLDNGATLKASVAHGSAPFAVTRWSNAYFPVNRWFGDPVGGPVAEEFGPGVRDVCVRVASHQEGTWAGLFLLAHTRYWRPDLDPYSFLPDPPEGKKQPDPNPDSSTPNQSVKGKYRSALLATWPGTLATWPATWLTSWPTTSPEESPEAWSATWLRKRIATVLAKGSTPLATWQKQRIENNQPPNLVRRKVDKHSGTRVADRILVDFLRLDIKRDDPPYPPASSARSPVPPPSDRGGSGAGTNRTDG